MLCWDRCTTPQQLIIHQKINTNMTVPRPFLLEVSDTWGQKSEKRKNDQHELNPSIHPTSM